MLPKDRSTICVFILSFWSFTRKGLCNWVFSLITQCLVNVSLSVIDSLWGRWSLTAQKLLTTCDCRTRLCEQSITGFNVFKEHLIPLISMWQNIRVFLSKCLQGAFTCSISASSTMLAFTRKFESRGQSDPAGACACTARCCCCYAAVNLDICIMWSHWLSGVTHRLRWRWR